MMPTAVEWVLICFIGFILLVLLFHARELRKIRQFMLSQAGLNVLGKQRFDRLEGQPEEPLTEIEQKIVFAALMQEVEE